MTTKIEETSKTRARQEAHKGCTTRCKGTKHMWWAATSVKERREILAKRKSRRCGATLKPSNNQITKKSKSKQRIRVLRRVEDGVRGGATKKSGKTRVFHVKHSKKPTTNGRKPVGKRTVAMFHVEHCVFWGGEVQFLCQSCGWATISSGLRSLRRCSGVVCTYKALRDLVLNKR